MAGSVIDEAKAWDSTTSPGSQLLKIIAHGLTVTVPNNEAIITDPNTTANMVYYGFAAIGSLTSANVWRIMRAENVSGKKIYTWADSNDSYDNIFDNRGSLTYG